MQYFKCILFLLVLGGVTEVVQAQAATTDSGMKWYSLEEAQLKAKEDGKKVLVFGYADWCTYCLKMRKEVYPDTSLQNRIYRNYYPVQLNGESEESVVYNGKEVKASELAYYLRLNSYPTHYFLNNEGEVFLAQPGFLNTEIFIPMVDYVGTDAYKEMDFNAFLESGN